jgi:hypothetical protein
VQTISVSAPIADSDALSLIVVVIAADAAASLTNPPLNSAGLPPDV